MKHSTTHIATTLALFCLLSLNGPGFGQEPDKVAKKPLGQTLKELVTELSAAPATARSTWLHEQLDARQLKYARHSFSHLKKAGRNFELVYGNPEKPIVLFCAPLDVRPRSAGANASSSACAILLHLITEQAQKPAISQNCQLRVLFYDQAQHHQGGILQWVEKNSGQSLAAAFNLGHCGIGDTFLIGPAIRPKGNLAGAYGQQWLKKAGKAEVFLLDRVLPAADRVLGNLGLDAVTVSILPKAEVLAYKNKFEAAKFGPMSATVKGILRGPDTAASVQEQALSASYAAIVSLWNSSQKNWNQGSLIHPRFSKMYRAFAQSLTEASWKEVQKGAEALGVYGTALGFQRALKRAEDAEKILNFAKKLFPRAALGAAPLSAESIAHIFSKKEIIYWNKDRGCFLFVEAAKPKGK